MANTSEQDPRKRAAETKKRNTLAALTQASDLIFEQPTFRIEDIAERAGVSSATAYTHFRTKSDLIRYVLEPMIGDPLATIFQQPDESSEAHLERTRRLKGADFLLDFLTENESGRNVAGHLYSAITLDRASRVEPEADFISPHFTGSFDRDPTFYPALPQEQRLFEAGLRASSATEIILNGVIQRPDSIQVPVFKQTLSRVVGNMLNPQVQ